MELITLENQEGKRVKGGSSGKGRRGAVIAAAVVLIAAVAGYAGLCAWVSSSGRIYPKTSVLGTDVSGMTAGEARQALQATLDQKLGGRTITLAEADTGHTTTVPCDIISVTGMDELLAGALPKGDFFSQGAAYFQHMLAETELSPTLGLTPSGVQALDTAVTQISTDLEHPMVETTYQMADSSLVLTKGTTGAAVDGDSLRAAVLDTLTEDLLNGGSGNLSIPISVTDSPPPDPDFESIHQEIYVEPVDAYLDKSTKEIVPSVTGVSFDIAAARSAVDTTPEGETVTVPLTYTEPDLTTAGLNAVLFRDVLSTSTTYCSGNSNRIANIKTAANKINGMILLPGEVFSYNDNVGPYTRASGYLPAGTYQGGKSVDALAGGICQLSSTLYWSTLKANLKIVERSNHQLTVGYLPDGCDATVFGGGPDFKFSNDTEQPIQIQAFMDGRNLTVKLIGTNAKGIHAEMETVRVSYDPMRTVYKASTAVPAGAAPQRDPAYPGHNGTVVQAYRVVYDANGNQISRTLESTNRYARQDRVYLYNPNDAASLGIDPATGIRGPVTATPTPLPTETPAVTPEVTPTPAVPTQQVPETQTPVATPAPTPEPPAPTPEPPVPTPEPPAPTPEPPEPTPEPPAPTPEVPASTPEPPPVESVPVEPPPEA